MKKIFLLLLFIPSIYAIAQKKVNPSTFAKTITADDLKRHLYIVASKEMEGRETATPGQKRAAAYIEQQFRSLGLLPGNNGSYQQYFSVYQDSLLNARFEVNGKAFQLDKDFNASLNSISATLPFSEVVFVGSKSADSLKTMNLTGKLVMLIAPAQMGFGRNQNQGGVFPVLQSKGVAGVILVSSSYPRTNAMSRKGQQSTSLYKAAIGPQQFTVSEEVAKAILGDDFENAKANTALIKTYKANILMDLSKTTQVLQSSNVLGVLEGTDLKNEYVFITAHYDHLGKRDTVIYYGADDDGSGTVSVLEMAEAFVKAKAAGNGPRRSMVFMTVSGEEKGLWGSDYYTTHPIFPLDKTSVDLNIDMIGRTDTSRKQGDANNYVYVVGDDKVSSDLKIISEATNKKYTKLELDYKFNDAKDPNRIYFRSDHYNFARNGVPIIFYYDGMLGADYHKPTDTPDKINYDLMAKRAQLVFYTGWDMANRDEMLKRDIKLEVPQRGF
jgi:hypothetical protein